MNASKACPAGASRVQRVAALLISRVFLVAATGVCGAAHAAPNPPGGYAASCRDISVVGATLRATCRNMAGNWGAPSTLNDYARCSGDIFNYDGSLGCSGRTPPRGTYQSSCSDVNVDRDDVLYGRCRTISGASVVARLQIAGCRQNIANIDGHLRCDGVGPPGSYAQTCWNIQQGGDFLRADCRSRSGGVKSTRIAQASWNEGCLAKGGDITNDDGELKCSPRISSAPPTGSGGSPACPWGNPYRDPRCGSSVNQPPVGTGPGVPPTPPPGTPPCCRGQTQAQTLPAHGGVSSRGSTTVQER